jgi:hypothetical protein
VIWLFFAEAARACFFSCAAYCFRVPGWWRLAAIVDGGVGSTWT